MRLTTVVNKKVFISFRFAFSLAFSIRSNSSVSIKIIQSSLLFFALTQQRVSTYMEMCRTKGFARLYRELKSSEDESIASTLLYLIRRKFRRNWLLLTNISSPLLLIKFNQTSSYRMFVVKCIVTKSPNTGHRHQTEKIIYLCPLLMHWMNNETYAL